MHFDAPIVSATAECNPRPDAPRDSRRDAVGGRHGFPIDHLFADPESDLQVLGDLRKPTGYYGPIYCWEYLTCGRAEAK